MTQRKQAIATRVSPYVNQSVRKLAKGLGISISEYLRKLILQDLDSRKMFQDELKKAVEQSEANDVTQRPRPRASAHTITQQLLEALAREENNDEQHW
jgi:predicted RecB family endonuclease